MVDFKFAADLVRDFHAPDGLMRRLVDSADSFAPSGSPLPPSPIDQLLAPLARHPEREPPTTD